MVAIGMAVRVVQVRVPGSQVDQVVTGSGDGEEEGRGGQAYTAKESGDQGGHSGTKRKRVRVEITL